VRITVRGSASPTTRIHIGSFLLLVVGEGEATIEIFSGAHALQNGDAFLFTSIEPLVFTTNSAFTGSWVELPMWWLLDILHREVVGARTRIDGTMGAVEVLRYALSRLTGPLSPSDDVNDLVDMFGGVLTRALKIAGRGERPAEGLVHRITTYVAHNYKHEGLCPQDAAAALGCSVSSVHKNLASIGSTFGKTLSAMRLSVAAYRLSRDDKSISEIAYDCGFISQSHFCHAFKERYGTTPTAVRRRHRVSANS
jgi:AraC-like DNA-binding protein